MSGVELQAFVPQRDLALLDGWLRQPHVSRWWGDPQRSLDAAAAHRPDSAALIVVDGRPLGYLCWQTPSRAELEEAGLDDLPADLIDIDIMLGEPAALGRGVGPAALRQLLDRLRACGVGLVGLAAARANTRAVRAYAKAGFRRYRDFREAGEDYRYFTQRLHGHQAFRA